VASRQKDWLWQAERDIEHARASVDDEHYEWACFAAQQGADAGEQLGIGEGFHQVVVGAGVEPFDAVHRSTACGEHQDGQVPIRAQLPAHLEPVDAGHHEIEDDKVGPARANLFERLGAAERDIDVVAFRTEDALDGRGNHRVVVDHEDPPGAHAHDRISCPLSIRMP